MSKYWESGPRLPVNESSDHENENESDLRKEARKKYWADTDDDGETGYHRLSYRCPGCLRPPAHIRPRETCLYEVHHRCPVDIKNNNHPSHDCPADEKDKSKNSDALLIGLCIPCHQRRHGNTVTDKRYLRRLVVEEYGIPLDDEVGIGHILQVIRNHWREKFSLTLPEEPNEKELYLRSDTLNAIQSAGDIPVPTSPTEYQKGDLRDSISAIREKKGVVWPIPADIEGSEEVSAADVGEAFESGREILQYLHELYDGEGERAPLSEEETKKRKESIIAKLREQVNENLELPNIRKSDKYPNEKIRKLWGDKESFIQEVFPTWDPEAPGPFNQTFLSTSQRVDAVLTVIHEASGEWVDLNRYDGERIRLTKKDISECPTVEYDPSSIGTERLGIGYSELMEDEMGFRESQAFIVPDTNKWTDEPRLRSVKAEWVAEVSEEKDIPVPTVADVEDYHEVDLENDYIPPGTLESAGVTRKDMVDALVDEYARVYEEHGRIPDMRAGSWQVPDEMKPKHSPKLNPDYRSGQSRGMWLAEVQEHLE